MPRRKGQTKPKDKFDALPPSFKDAVEGMSREDMEKRLSTVAKDEEANRMAKASDQDLKYKKDAAKVASQVYSETTKLNRLMTQYLIRALSDKGDEKSEEIVRLTMAADEQKTA